MQTSTLIFPEIILLEAYNKALNYIRSNYKANKTTPDKSYLATIIGNTGTNVLDKRYDFYTQAVAVFNTTEQDPRNLLVNLFFNAKRAHIPTIHITNPAEMAIHDSLSIGEGFQNPIIDDTAETYTAVFNRRFKAKYNILFTSDNTNEVVLLYNIMRTMSISLIEHLQLSGLENIKLSGNEINIKTDIIPENIFIKGIGLEFEYDVPALKLSTNDLILSFTPKGTAVSGDIVLGNQKI